MAKMRKNKKQCEVKYGAAGPVAGRIADARKAGEIAALIFGDATAVNVASSAGKNPEITNIINAIDGEDFGSFRTACINAGIQTACAAAAPAIDFEDLVERLWDATYGSLGPQSVKPCW